jgi:uncharacterized protein (UPF0332 family)
MKTLRANHLLYCLAGIAALLAVGCTTAPVQEMSDARQAIAAARDADAARRTPELLNSAEHSLRDAQLQLKNYFYTEARKRAIAAKAQAVQARREAEAQQHVEQQHAAQVAIAAAQRAIQDAAALEGLWRESDSVLKSAETAMQSGDYAQAQTQAAVAEQQALLAINQAYLEKARYLINATKSRHHLTNSQRATVKEAEAALRKHDGKQAYTLISPLR